MTIKRLITGLIGVALIVAAAGLAFAWTVCRVYVKPNQCLVLIRKTGDPLPAGQKIAEPGQRGIQREALGPGRYFFNPWKWEWEHHDAVMISAGDPATWQEVWQQGDPGSGIAQMQGTWPEVGIVTNLAGKKWDKPDEVVDEDYQGIQRNVLTPGVYRLNPYAYKVEKVPAVIIPLGCVGVVTSQIGKMPGVETIEEISIGPDGEPIKGHAKVVQKLAEEGQRGVLKNVLQPGYLLPESEGPSGEAGADRLQPDLRPAHRRPQHQHRLPIRRRLHHRRRGHRGLGTPPGPHARDDQSASATLTRSARSSSGRPAASAATSARSTSAPTSSRASNASFTSRP